MKPPALIRSLLLPTLVLAGPSLLPAQQNSQFELKKNNVMASDTPEHQIINPQWKVVWADEFNAPKIDLAKWNFEIDGKGGGNGEKQYYTDDPENAYIEKGCLVIKAIKDGVYQGKPHAFTSARMTTKGKGDWLYGRMEARIKLPGAGVGYWPAFWMMPTDSKYGTWALSGEIDIVEMVGHQPNIAYGTIHYGDKWPKNIHTGDQYHLASGNLGDAFHVYAVEWEPGTLRWYFDGKLYQTQKSWQTKSAPFPAPFDEKFFIILNLAIGGAWPKGPAKDTVFPASMVVDYVRVYQSAEQYKGTVKYIPPAEPAGQPKK